jgi:hypothetical protein
MLPGEANRCEGKKKKQQMHQILKRREEKKKKRKKESDSHTRIEILFILTRSNVAMKLMLFL